MEKKTFGATLAELRRLNGMTQLDLADKLGVTDKAVSKWERDLALPEVENLIKISDIFGVSLDALLRGEEPPTVETVEKTVPAAVVQPVIEPAFPPRKLVGTILLCFGALTALLLAIFSGELLASLIFASPFFLCGAVCIIFKKRLGLLCSWTVYFCVYTYLGYATGLYLSISFSLLSVALARITDVWTQVIVSFIFVAVFILLTIWTALSFRKEKFSFKKVLAVLIASVVVYVLISIFSAMTAQFFADIQRQDFSDLRYFARVLRSVADFFRNLSIMVFFTSLVNLISNRRKKID